MFDKFINTLSWGITGASSGLITSIIFQFDKKQLEIL